MWAKLNPLNCKVERFSPEQSEIIDLHYVYYLLCGVRACSGVVVVLGRKVYWLDFLLQQMSNVNDDTDVIRVIRLPDLIRSTEDGRTKLKAYQDVWQKSTTKLEEYNATKFAQAQQQGECVPRPRKAP